MPSEPFDRFLRYDELVSWLHEMAGAYPTLVQLDTYGRSHEGRDLWLVTITDSSTGTHDTKPAMWIDANIHSVELTASTAALYLIHHLVTHAASDERVARALRTRTFYVVPRVNPDGAEWALADNPKYRRSSTRPWPWADAHLAPGTHVTDIDGDGRVLTMRVVDPNGPWMVSPDDARLLVQVPPDGAPGGAVRYRLFGEGEVVDYDGFTAQPARPPEALDMNRNFPAGWGTGVPGSGDHPLSEPEIDALVRAVMARPNVCGYNAFHTSGGFLLRPSSTRSDGELAPLDVWTWKQLGARGTELTAYPVHSVFEDLTRDKSETMSGAADDWAYEHLGVHGWTTEFWDVIHAATGTRCNLNFWYEGPTAEQELAVLRWADEHHPELFVDWYPFDHPQLGPLEIGSWDWMHVWANPPRSRLADEVRPHADFAVYLALAAPQIEVVHQAVERLGDEVWRVSVGVANTGWLPTDISAKARKERLVLPLVAELGGAVSGPAATVIGGPARLELGQLEGAQAARFTHTAEGTPDRALASWTVRATAGSTLTVDVRHQRAGRTTVEITLPT
jgi:hypothetical protein